jgi:hypothetical protein
MVKVGDVVKATSKAGSEVERMVVAVLEPPQVKAINVLQAKNKFVPIFRKDNVIYVGMSKPTRKKLTPEQIKEKAAKKEADRIARAKTREDERQKNWAKVIVDNKSANDKIESYQDKVRELTKDIVSKAKKGESVDVLQDKRASMVAEIDVLRASKKAVPAKYNPNHKTRKKK